MKKITSIDIIKNFYISNELLKEVFAIKSKDKKKIENKLKSIFKKADKLKDKFYLQHNLDNWHMRYDHYLNSRWELKKIKLEDCGVWPKMGGLPKDFTYGNVLETASKVDFYLKNKDKLTLETSRVLYVERMKEYAEILNEFFPIIVMEDGVIRNHKLIRKEEKGKYKKCKYDIEDGNHRAIALALLGKKEINAFVGKRICKNDLLYY